MARLIVYLPEPERDALHTLAQSEYRLPRAQAALIIHKELERLGMLSSTQEFQPASESSQEAVQ